MVKTVRCTKCEKTFEVTGERGNMREVEQGVMCPYCREPNEILWPMDMAFFVRKVPSEM